MASFEKIFENNRLWVAEKLNKDPEYFEKLAKGQAPEFLYIGCSDSRVTAEDLMGAQPGEIFVHRNVANLVVNTDLNVMSVINYAIRHLKVKHVVVCGHYGCGGVKAAMEPKDLGLLNPWLRNIRDVYRMHQAELDAIADTETRYKKLIEINVIEQCINVMKTAELQERYLKEGQPTVHGWVFDISTGHIKDLGFNFKEALDRIRQVYGLTTE
jgi:carbonic anhydrase